jgi:hypothetical protein
MSIKDHQPFPQLNFTFLYESFHGMRGELIRSYVLMEMSFEVSEFGIQDKCLSIRRSREISCSRIFNVLQKWKALFTAI